MQKLKRIARSAAAAITGLAASLTVGVTNALAAGGGSGVNISANSSGLPGLTQSETIVGALITARRDRVGGRAWPCRRWCGRSATTRRTRRSPGAARPECCVSSSSAVLCGGAMAIVNFFFNIGAQI